MLTDNIITNTSRQDNNTNRGHEQLQLGKNTTEDREGLRSCQ
jgi:hypothetical protein